MEKGENIKLLDYIRSCRGGPVWPPFLLTTIFTANEQGGPYGGLICTPIQR